MAGHVAVYTRISRDQAGRSEGVARQEKACRAYASEHFPGSPIEVYSDNDITAADPEVERPAFEKLVSSIRAGDVDEVICAEQSRLTRQPSEWEDLVYVLSRAGIEYVHTLRGGVVSVAADNRLMGRILAAVDAEEVERARERIRRAHRSLAEQGRPAGGKLYGYVRDRDLEGRSVLLIDPTEAAIIRRIADEVEAGEPLLSIADRLTADGVPTPRRAERWSSTGVRSTVTRPTVAGLRSHKGQIVATGTWEPILPELRWRRVVALLGGDRVVTGKNGRVRRVSARQTGPPRKYLLSGLCRCGRCGGVLQAVRQARRTGASVAAYGCTPRSGADACSGVSVVAEAVEEIVTVAVLEVLGTGRLDQLLTTDDDELRSAADELQVIEGRLGELGEMFVDGAVDRATLEAGQRTAQTRAERLRAQIEASHRTSAAPIEALSGPMDRETWDALPVATRREIVALLAEDITVAPSGPTGPTFDPSRVRINWRS